MSWVNSLKDAFKRKRSRDFAQELSYQFLSSPICSDYENLFAQVRPLIDEMKVVMPYGVTDRGTRLKEDKTPELAWLKNPNDDMGWAEFADLMFATWLTEEELDIHVWRDKRGRVEGYTILPQGSRIYLGYGRWEWQAMTTSGLEVLTEDEVMRLRFSRSPRDIQRGVSPASAVRVWAQIDDLIAQYQRAYFENGAIPATITFITASTQEKYIATRRELENNLKGARNRNKTVYAWRQFDNDTGQSVDQVEVKTIQGNNSTLAIKEIVDIVNDRLNKSVGVSNFILGDDSSAKYDNAELSDHQFTKRRVYPALVSFWNQFQHELERILGGGLGYGITFDLEIPELTERTKAKAEIARIRSEALVNLISAGASGTAAVRALGLPENWQAAADGIYAKGLAGNLLSPVSVDYEAPKPVEATVDSVEGESKPTLPLGEHTCSCHHSIDELPPMNERELKLYNVMIELAKSIMEQADPTKAVDVENVIEKMVEILREDAIIGGKEGAEALALLAEEDVANEILNTVSNGDVYVSEALGERIRTRAEQLAQGFADHAQGIVEETLATEEPLSASEIKSRLMSVVPLTRAELIARNETLYAIRSGRLEQDEKLAEKYGLQVKLVWRTSGDSRVCPVCAAMAGKTVDLGKPFDDTVTTEDGELAVWGQNSWNDNGRITSAHVNCVLGDTKVLADGVKAATKMLYSGEVVKLKTASGNILAVTPNHILLTQRGWVAAKNIKNSDKVVAYSDGVEVPVVDNAVDGDIPTIADEFVSLSKSAGVLSVEVPVTPKDFKGDALTDEKVQVILPNSLLRNIGNVPVSELSSYLPFVGGKIDVEDFPTLSSIDQLLVGLLLASNSVVGGSCESLALIGSKTGHADIHRFTSATAYNTRLQEAATDRSSADMETLSDSFLANAGLIKFDDVVDIQFETVHNTPVYDLETTSTLYTANGVISSNCRCYWDEELV